MLQRFPLRVGDITQPTLAHQPVVVPATLVEPLAELGTSAMLPVLLAVQVQPLLKGHPVSCLQTCIALVALRHAGPQTACMAAQERMASFTFLVPQEPPALLEPVAGGLGHSLAPPLALLEPAAGGLGKHMAAASLVDAKGAVQPTDEVVDCLCSVHACQAPPVALVTCPMGWTVQASCPHMMSWVTAGDAVSCAS